MLDTYLNPIEIKIGTTVHFTHEYKRDNKRLVKLFPEFLDNSDFEVLEIREVMAEDYLTELREKTSFVTKMKCVKTSKIYTISEVDAVYEEAHGESLYAAFFTSETPDWVVITNKFTLGTK